MPAPSLGRFSISGKMFAERETAFLQGVLLKMGVFVMVFIVFLWSVCGVFVVGDDTFLASKKMPTFQNIFLYND